MIDTYIWWQTSPEALKLRLGVMGFCAIGCLAKWAYDKYWRK